MSVVNFHETFRSVKALYKNESITCLGLSVSGSGCRICFSYVTNKA